MSEPAFGAARQAIVALTRPAEKAFAQSFQQSVDDLARRYGVRTATAIEQEVVVTAEQAEAVLRITAEALRDAVRHGQASCVCVASTASPLTLTVEDDGSGFHPEESTSRGSGPDRADARVERVARVEEDAGAGP